MIMSDAASHQTDDNAGVIAPTAADRAGGACSLGLLARLAVSHSMCSSESSRLADPRR